MRRTTILSLLAILAVVIGGCGQSAITRPRLERSLAPAFSRLYVQQAALLGHKDVSVDSLETHAFCDKAGPAMADEGPGADWLCYLNWKDPNLPLPDGTARFEMNVHSNGCYTAGGPSRTIGQLQITSVEGKLVDNPVFEFDGCFDTTSANTPVPLDGPPASVTLPTGKVEVSDGAAAPVLTCSKGATGGCIGTLTARIGTRTVGTIGYQLPPGGENDFTLPLPSDERRTGTAMQLTAAPFLGRAPRPESTVTLAPAPPD